MNVINTTNEHPLWDIYDEYRTARLTVRYYEQQLKILRRKNLLIELVLALSASSGVAGLWLWETAVGGYIWKALATLAAFLAVLKPVVKLSDQIQRKGEVLADWRSLDSGLQQLVITVSQGRSYNNELQERFFALMAIKATIVQREPPEAIDTRLRQRCYEQVNQELPADNFFIPEDISEE